MATIVAAATGNWSAGATWVGGVKPGVGDSAQTDEYVVTIDENVTCVQIEATSSGHYELANGVTVTANVLGNSSYASGNVRVLVAAAAIVGNITATTKTCVVNGSTGTLTITGNVTGGTAGYGLENVSSGTVNITGTVTGGSSANYMFGAKNWHASGTINITGDVVGGSSVGSCGIRNESTGTVTVSGSAIGGSGLTAYGAYNYSTGTLIVNKAVGVGLVAGIHGNVSGGTSTFKIAETGANGDSPLSGYCKMEFDQDVNYVRVIRSDTSATVDLSNDYPAIADVKKDVVYKLTTLTGTLEGGTCDYPAEADVRAGVDYDSANYTGTLDLPAEADVKDSVTYDGATKTGTYDPLSAAVFPAEANTLEAESAYGPTGAEYAGTYHAPDAAEVIDSAVFGPGSSIAGTYDTSGTPPSAADIADAVWNEARAGHVAAGSFGAVAEWASTGGLDAAGVRTAIGLATANLDTQLGTLATSAELATDAEIATAVAAAILVTPANRLDTDASGYVKITGTKNTLDDLNDVSLAELFTSDSGETYATAVAGSVVKEIADNAVGTGAIAVSSTTAASVSTGAFAVRTHHTLSQAITSTYSGNLSAATKLWLAVKAEKDDTDAQAVIFIEATAGLTVLAGAAYTTVAHGSLTVGGLAGAWTVTVALDEVATGLLTPYADGMLWAECKALVAGSTVAVWDGVCDVARGIVNAVT